MSGDDQHYLPAALIGGFGIVRAGKPLRKAQIVVRELASGQVHRATAEDVAFRRALYRLLAPEPGVNPDIVDKLWTPVETELPALVARLDADALEPDDPEKWIRYAAMAGVRNPTAFLALAVHHQQQRGEPEPVDDQIQVMRVEALLADQALEQLAWLAVAGRRFTRYVEGASRLGTDHWREVEALATSALRSKRRDLAVEVFRAADRPGRHQKLLRERCASLTGVVIGEAGGDRPSLRVVRASTSGSVKR